MHLLRKLIFVIGLAMMMAAQQGYALGLGESELHSALNQPLRADIRLTNLRGLSENEIIVRLASLEDFERAGLDRLPFYNQLEFELMLDHPDGPMVRITTDDPVKEPYLNFLVEARWASGRLLREYTFLLDLPTFDEERQAQPVQTAPAQGQRPRATPQQSRETTSQPRRETSQAPAYAGETYEVGSSDTLWEIALRVRPGRDLSVHQTMLAIQRKNPEAFINGNINLLKEGQVLRLPDRSEIQGLDQQRAVREVAEHNREWSEGSTMGAQLDAGQREQSSRRGPSEVSGQVRLAAPGGSGEAGQGGGNSTDSGAELESELAAAQEELDKTQRENRELSNRVEELESQIETMESLIEASNEQLSALQAAAANRSEAAQSAQDESAAASSSAQSEMAEVAQTQASEAPEQVEPEPAAAPVEADRDDRATRVVRSVPEEKTLVDHLMDNLLWIAAGLLVILLAIYAFIRHRASQSEPTDDSFEEDFEPTYEEEGFAAESDTDHYDEEEAGIDLSEEEDFDPGAEPWEEDAEPGVEAETGDVVGEADIYIAYGKLDQAEELLLKGLEKEPNSPAILSKLLEVYAENRDVAAFDRYYATLLGTDDRMAIQRAGELRDTIPGAGEFDISALEESASDEPKVAGTEADDAYDLSEEQDDLDFSFDLDESKDKTEDDEELNLDGDFNFDLDDDLDLEETPEKPVAATSEGDIESSPSRYDLSFEETPEEKEDEFALDFDLEDDDSVVSLEERAPAGEKETSGKDDEDSFPDLDLKLDEDDLASEGDAEKISADDDWSFDLEADDSTGANLESLDDELSLLDEEATEDNAEVRLEPSDDLSAEASDDWEDDLKVEDFGLDDEATSEDEQEAGEDAFAELDDALAKATEEPQGDKPAEPEGAPAESESADEPDLDLDDVDMNDMDLSSLDEEMSGLDVDLDDEEDKPSAPAQEEELSLSSEEPEQSVSADVDEDQMFEEALSGLETEETPDADEAPAASTDEQGSGEDMDAELDFLADTDEAATKLDLARAYIDMGDADGARDILEEVRQEGNEQQQQEAAELLSRIES